MWHSNNILFSSQNSQDNLRRRIVQDVIRTVVASDRDNSGDISPKEAKTLALKIRIQLESYGVEFDCDKFIKVIGLNSSITKVISIVQKLMTADNEDTDEEADDLDEEDYDMFYIMEDDASISVTSEDIIGATLAFGGDSVGGSKRSLIADARKKTVVGGGTAVERVRRKTLLAQPKVGMEKDPYKRRR